MPLFPVHLFEIMFIKVRIYYTKIPSTYQVSRHIIIKGLHIEYHIINTTITTVKINLSSRPILKRNVTTVSATTVQYRLQELRWLLRLLSCRNNHTTDFLCSWRHGNVAYWYLTNINDNDDDDNDDDDHDDNCMYCTFWNSQT